MYENDEPMPADQELDPRVIAVQRVVDLERDHQWAQRDADERQKKAAILGEELSEARDVLAGLLGYPSKSSNVRAMSGEMARSLAGGAR